LPKSLYFGDVLTGGGVRAGATAGENCGR
jgi:hypothetical protein